ncbi:MAG: ABC transporter permease subunit [Chloroflexi bacterium]|nr:ABC transporter permease subunit [Chloroflexota bacterium]
MAQNNPDLAAPRTFFDGRGLVRNIIMRRSWFIAFILIDIFVLYSIFNSEVMIEAWDYIVVGIGVTVQITILSFLLSLVIGLIVALGRISKNVIIYNVTTLYVELFRGLPLLVIILIFAFVVTPALVDLIAGTETLPGIPFLDNFIQSIVGIDPAVIDTTTLRRAISTRWCASYWRSRSRMARSCQKCSARASKASARDKWKRRARWV